MLCITGEGYPSRFSPLPQKTYAGSQIVLHPGRAAAASCSMENEIDKHPRK